MGLGWDDVFLYGRTEQPKAAEEPKLAEPETKAKAETAPPPRKITTPAAMMAAGLQTMARAAVETKKPVWADLPCYSC